MLKLLVLIALIYLFVRMFLNYKASLSTMKTWEKSHWSFINDFDLFTPNDNSDPFTENENSFGYHQGYQGMEINPATGLPMMGCVDVCGNPYGFDMHHCGSTHAFRDHGSSFGGYGHDD